MKGFEMLYQFLASMFALVFLNVPVFAQGANCGERADIVAQLTEKYGEARQNVGMNQNNSLVEVFASEATGTWTILVTMPTGVSCLVAAGQNWQVVEAEDVPAGKPA
jgi:hypothetical protein